LADDSLLPTLAMFQAARRAVATPRSTCIPIDKSVVVRQAPVVD